MSPSPMSDRSPAEHSVAPAPSAAGPARRAALTAGRPRPRVAHFTVPPEFVEKIMLDDLVRLRDREDATVICAPGPAVDAVRAAGFRVLTVAAHRKITPLQDIASLWELWKLLRRERFDLLHSYGPKGGLLGQLAAALARVPRRVHAWHGLLYMPGMRAWRRRLFRTTDRVTNGLAHRTIYISAADREFSVREGLCAPDTTRYTGSGIDLARYSLAAVPPGTREAVRARLGVGPDDVLVLTVGRFVADKGYRELAAAATALRGDHPRLRYVWAAPTLIGEDGVLPDSLPADHGIADIVTHLAYMAEVTELYASADLLVHPSYREGVPCALMEAAAMGVPVLATDIPGCREVVRHGETALLFAPRDPDALAAAVRAAIGDPAATRARAAAAERDVRARFDRNVLGDRIWAVHDELLAGDDRAEA